jgi:hypothetical protein
VVVLLVVVFVLVVVLAAEIAEEPMETTEKETLTSGSMAKQARYSCRLMIMMMNAGSVSNKKERRAENGIPRAYGLLLVGKVRTFYPEASKSRC